MTIYRTMKMRTSEGFEFCGESEKVGSWHGSMYGLLRKRSQQCGLRTVIVPCLQAKQVNFG